jgi:hypothetical protein
MPPRHDSPSLLKDSKRHNNYDHFLLDSPVVQQQKRTTMKRKSYHNQTKDARLSFLPNSVAVDIGFLSKAVPGIKHSISNISESTGGNTNEVYMAYEKFAEDNEHDGDDHSTDSKNSKVSFSSQPSQDTFSTSPAKLKRKIARFCPGSIDLCCFWNLHFAWAQSVVKSRIFKRILIALILINCFICAVATADSVTEDKRRVEQFDVLKGAFVWIMTIELILQFLGNGLRFFTDGWLVFDLFVIGVSWSYQNFLVMRTFRIVRTLR